MRLVYGVKVKSLLVQVLIHVIVEVLKTLLFPDLFTPNMFDLFFIGIKEGKTITINMSSNLISQKSVNLAKLSAV